MQASLFVFVLEANFNMASITSCHFWLWFRFFQRAEYYRNRT